MTKNNLSLLVVCSLLLVCSGLILFQFISLGCVCPYSQNQRLLLSAGKSDISRNALKKKLGAVKLKST